MKKYVVRFVFIVNSLFFITPLAAQYFDNQQTVALETGTAMFYADYFHGEPTAFGETYSKYDFTCSHPTHPKGTILKVTRVNNGKSTTVRVNDKGTFSGDVIISLSRAAAADLDLIKVGKAVVTVEVAGTSKSNPVTINRETFTERNADVSKTYSTDTRPAKTQSSDQLTPKGGTGFQWNKPAAAKAGTVNNNTPSNYSVASNNNTVNSGYGIQIGSYGVYDNADRQIATLRNSGITNAFVKESITSNGGKLYRIMVGSFVSRTEAQDYLQSLRNQAVADGIVVDLSK